MDLRAKRAAELEQAAATIELAEKESRQLTDAERDSVKAHISTVESIDGQLKAAADAAGLKAQLDGLGAPPANSAEGQHLTGGIGDKFVKSAGYQAFKAAHPTGLGSGTPVRVDAKDLGGLGDLGIGSKATVTTQTGQPSPVREPGYYNLLAPDEPLTFLDLVTSGVTDVPYGEYAQVIAETNNAAIVAEGGLKPLSDVTTDKAESKAYTYADGFDITNQTLADDGALAAFLEARIKQHVLGLVEQKLFNGSGAGVEPTGIMNTTGTLAQAFVTDMVTSLARAVEKFELNNGDTAAQAIVMNSSDIWSLRLLKDDNGQYLLGNPLQQKANPTPWGINLVKSNKLAAGTALVGRFDSVHFLLLEALSVQAFNQHKDYAQRNMVYVRAELRGRQLFYMPREVVVASVKAA